LFGDIAHRDIAGLSGQLADEFSPHSRAAAGDDRDPSREILHGSPLGFDRWHWYRRMVASTPPRSARVRSARVRSAGASLAWEHSAAASARRSAMSSATRSRPFGMERATIRYARFSFSSRVFRSMTSGRSRSELGLADADAGESQINSPRFAGIGVI